MPRTSSAGGWGSEDPAKDEAFSREAEYVEFLGGLISLSKQHQTPLTCGLPPTNPKTTEISGKNARSSSEQSVVPGDECTSRAPSIQAPFPSGADIAASSYAAASKRPSLSLATERGARGRSRRVRHTRRKAAVSWKRMQRSPAEEFTTRTPAREQGNRILARGLNDKRRRASTALIRRACNL